MMHEILITQVKAMRKAQDKYRRTHSWRDQDECRRLEKDVDRILEELDKSEKARIEKEQMRLF